MNPFYALFARRGRGAGSWLGRQAVGRKRNPSILSWEEYVEREPNGMDVCRGGKTVWKGWGFVM